MTHPNLPIHTANPARIKAYIASLGIKAKTDNADAAYIAQYALERQPESRQNRGKTHAKLKKFLAARRQLVDAKQRLKCQVKHFVNEKMILHSRSIAIDPIEKQIKAITKRIADLIEKDQELKKQFELLITMPGIGKIVTITLLVDCLELSEISAVKVFALAGLAPYANQSGTKERKRRIWRKGECSIGIIRGGDGCRENEKAACTQGVL